jgi:AraC-like DNA-binding protein/ligand-binding sensor protein
VNKQYYVALVQLPELAGTLAAFAEATGVPARLLPLDPTRSEEIPKPDWNPLCRLLLGLRQGHAECRAYFGGLQARMRRKPETACVECFAGLKQVVVPVMADGQPRAMLVCGPVLAHHPSRVSFGRLMTRLEKQGIALNRKQAWLTYRKCRVFGRTEIHGTRRLLNFVSAHLSESLERCLRYSQGAEPDCVSRGRQFAQEHLDGQVSSHEAAAAAAVCPQYFCRSFKASTGATFTEYVCRCRVDKAKHLLAESRLRINEIAFACGFQSIPYFNRTFKRYTGLAPTAYRATRQELMADKRKSGNKKSFQA